MILTGIPRKLAVYLTEVVSWRPPSLTEMVDRHMIPHYVKAGNAKLMNPGFLCVVAIVRKWPNVLLMIVAPRLYSWPKVSYSRLKSRFIAIMMHAGSCQIKAVIYNWTSITTLT